MRIIHLVILGTCCLISFPSLNAKNELKTASEVLMDRKVDFSRASERAAAASKIRSIGQERMAKARAKAKALGWQTRMEKPGGGLIELYDFEGDQPVYIETKNVNAAISTGVDLLHVAPYNLDGSGLIVGLWDAGAVRSSHQEFSGGRVIVQDGGVASFHPTNIAGTIGAAGVVAAAKGMAFNTQIHSYDWQDDNAEMILRAASGPNQFDTHIYLSNHSYGLLSGWSGVVWYGDGSDQSGAEYNFGQYSKVPQAHDSIIYNSPYYLSVWSSGNDGRDNPRSGTTVRINNTSVTYDPTIHPAGDGAYRNGFETISAQGVGKNVLTIAAVEDAVTSGLRDPSKAILAEFSSIGPTDDGRIKPDLVGNGVGLYTTTSLGDTDYGSSTGTSMAAPNVTGSAALVIDQYKRLFNSAMRASTLKGLLIHTATDLGNPGPDYKYGWGLADVKKAVDLVRDHHADTSARRITEDRLTASESSRVYPFTWNSNSAIRATLCWTDPPGPDTSEHDSRVPRLVNDLNLKLVAPDGSEYFPFVMPFVGTWTTASMNHKASTGVNDRDNVEQILIENPGQYGQWQWVVDHVGVLTDGEQYFSLMTSLESAASSVLLLRSVAPSSRSRDTTEPIEIYGSGFVAGSTLTLTRSGELDIAATSASVVSLGLLRAQFDLSGAALGLWDLTVSNPDGQTATLSDAFEVNLSLNTALDTSGFDWANDGDHPWQTQQAVALDGVDAAQSGVVADNRISSLSTSFTESGDLTFYWKVSSEQGGDYLRLLRNGSELTGALGAISGEVDWVQKTVPIPNGTTTVEWRYTKDLSGSAGEDAAWLDQVVFTPIARPGLVVEQAGGAALLSGTSTLDSGPYLVGESSPATTVTIRNTGTADLTGLTLVKSGSHSADFVLGSLGATTLAVGESTSFTVSFTPTEVGARSIDLQILSNDPIFNPFQIVLSGTGLDAGALSVSSTGESVPYGPPGGPFTPASVQYTLTNPGGNAINWTATKDVDWFDISPASGTIAALGETTVTISFNASAEALGIGEYEGRVSFEHLGSGSADIERIVPLAVVNLPTALDGSGIAWSTSGDANWFAQTAVTQDGVDAAQSGGIARNRSSSLSTTLQGPGTLTFYWKVSSDVFGDYLEFYLDNTLQTGDLRRIAGDKDWTRKTVSIPEGTHTVEWRYTKDTYVDSGADAGWVDEVTFTVPAPEIVVEQPLGVDLIDGEAAVDFVLYEAGDAPPVSTFTIRNSGEADLSGLALSLTGANAADFSLGVLGGTTLAPGDSTSFTVTFTSAVSGIATAALQIASNDENENPFNIDLIGRNLATPYQLWAFGKNLSGSDGESAANPDFDALTNLQEFAFGTDPSVPDFSQLEFEINGALTTAGIPRLMDFAQSGEAHDFRAVFTRLKDHLNSGLIYSVEFTADLERWTLSSVMPTVLTDPDSAQDYEVVSLPFPESVPVGDGSDFSPARFVRISVSEE